MAAVLYSLGKVSHKDHHLGLSTTGRNGRKEELLIL